MSKKSKKIPAIEADITHGLTKAEEALFYDEDENTIDSSGFAGMLVTPAYEKTDVEEVVFAEQFNEAGELVAQLAPIAETQSVAIQAETTPAKIKAPQASKKNFANQIKDVTDDQLHETFMTVGKAFDDRIAYENAKFAPSSKIASLEESAKRLLTAPALKALLVTGTDLNFANVSNREGSRYNIYAIRDKIVDLCDALGKDKGILENKINLAVMRSMFAYRTAGIPFTGNSAILATSDKIRVTDKTLNAILVRHTVSQVTAGTQASSTMSALQTMGIVKNIGTSKAAVYEFTGSAAVKHLEAMLAPAKAA